MIFEDKSTECQHCHKKKLILISHVRTTERDTKTFISTLQCDLCHREYTLRDGKLAEKREERDPVAESIAMHKAEVDAVRNRRCPHCGGPIDDFLTCDWCHEKYAVKSGELVRRIEDLLSRQRKPRINEFYVISTKQ